MLLSIKVLQVCPSGQTKFVFFKNFADLLKSAGGRVRIRHYFDERVAVIQGRNGLRFVCQYRGFSFTSLSYDFLEKFYWVAKAG